MDNNNTNVESIDEYIAAFSPEVQQILQEIRQRIRDSAPEAREKISYQMPTFEQHGNLVHFAAYSNHIGFYPAPSGIEAFKEELAGYKSSKGAIQFPLGQPVPLELISRIVKFRVAENAEKAALKKEAKKKRK
ncbi:DUF1801 domain-containing protein [Paenibacillus albidus]|uniref:iron chaperone n=1 Tax=Paenibacillus albidus TaxID=2041023 RepID=UPI001BE5715F|nr:DUF1801 domain-containing protein [Paenibacillus albidus]MBT2292944.1 DUF1801 domain-containing protein [Paenibacillus albidus]